MRNFAVLLVFSLLLLAGCATSDKKISDMESRLSALETKCGVVATQEAAPETQSVTNETATATATPEIVVPENPSKKEIQNALKNAGYYDGPVDGKFGPKTKKAVEDFQTANSLKADGKVGPNTWEKLKTYYSAIEVEGVEVEKL